MGGFVNKMERIKDYMRSRGGDPFYITIFGSSDYGNKVLSQLTAGLPSVTLRISAAELKAYPCGVTGRVFSFLFADLYGFIVLDQEVLKYLSGASGDNELLYLIYARARANRKIVIAITEQMPLPERVSFHSSLYICSRQRLKKLTAVYPGIESAAIIHGEDYYDSFESLFEQVKCFLRR